MREISQNAVLRTAEPVSARTLLINACTLSCIAGFVDTCVFVGMFGLFTAHITGNLALIGAELVRHSGDVLAKLLALPVFVAAIVLTVLATDSRRRAGHSSVAPLLCAEAALLILTIVMSVAFGPVLRPDAPWTVIAGMFAVGAMGLQNALMRIELLSLPATTVMTVNVTQTVIDALAIVMHRADSATDVEHLEQARRRFKRMWPPILAFALGAAFGAVGYAWLRLDALICPAILCLALAARMPRR